MAEQKIYDSTPQATPERLPPTLPDEPYYHRSRAPQQNGSAARLGKLLVMIGLIWLAIELIGMVPEDEHVVVSTNRGMPVALDGKSRAGQAFRNIARRLEGEKIPFLSMDEDGSLLGRLTRLIRPGGA